MFLGHINYSSDMLTIHLDIVEFLPECEMTIKQFDMYESVHVTDILNNQHCYVSCLFENTVCTK